MPMTTLIQRLKNPDGQIHHAFGGGIKNGGLSNEAMEGIKNVWAFDYMGNSRFEYGKVAEALTKIKDYSQAGRVFFGEVDSIEVPYICEKGEEDEVKGRILQLYDRKLRSSEILTVENPFFREAMTVDKAPYNQFGGWLELDNGFMFFKNKKMYNDTICTLLLMSIFNDKIAN